VLGLALRVGTASALANIISLVLVSQGNGVALADIIFAGADCLATGIVLGPWPGRAGKPRTLVFPWPGLRQYRQLLQIAILFLIIPFTTVVFGSMPWPFYLISDGFTFVPAAWLAFGLRAILTTPAADAPSATAAATYRADRISGVVTGVATGVAFGVIGGLVATTASSGWGSFVVGRLDVAAPLAFTAAVAVRLMAGQVPLLKFTQYLLCWRHRDRVDFLRLFEEASRLQVLPTSRRRLPVPSRQPPRPPGQPKGRVSPHARHAVSPGSE
jgi:hypothetical protein